MVKRAAEKPADRSQSKYKGVRKRKWGKWVSEIRLPNSRERIWLGSYDSAEKAARAFDAALFCLRGRTATFNFPDNPPAIAGGRSLSPPEIQAAAASYANDSDAPSRLSDQSSTEEPSTSESQAESPSASVVSDGTALFDDGCELMLDMPFLDLLANSNMGSDYGLFPDFDDLHNDFFAPPLITGVEYGEENLDGTLAQDSFLWNF